MKANPTGTAGMMLRRRLAIASTLLGTNLVGCVGLIAWLVLHGLPGSQVGGWLWPAVVGIVLLANVGVCGMAVRLRKNVPVYEEAFVALILDSVDAAITVYDAQGKLLRANKGAEVLSGYSAAELHEDATWRAILPGDDYEQVTAIVAGDGEAAAAAMISHLDAVMAELLTLAHKQPEIFADRPGVPTRAAALAVKAPRKRKP